MKERPILFSGPMVRALLAGTKTQTRRIIKPQPDQWTTADSPGMRSAWPAVNRNNRVAAMRCPYGQPGDRLWVRETWRTDAEYDAYAPNQIDSGASLFFLADHREHRINRRPECGPHEWGKTRGSIHMPRWASRILLETTVVRVERLQDISEADALTEGISCENVIVACHCYGGSHVEESADRYFFDGCAEEGFESAVDAYAGLWESINGSGSWAANPWVWCIEFNRVTP